jgi:hypothetical protein
MIIIQEQVLVNPFCSYASDLKGLAAIQFRYRLASSIYIQFIIKYRTQEDINRTV